MNGELARKTPASVVDAQPLRPMGRATIQTNDKARLDRTLATLYKNGRISPEWTVRRSPIGYWTADVTFHERRIPQHRRPTSWLKIWAIGMVSALALMTGYVVAKAIALAVAAIVPFIVGAAFILAAFALLAGRKIVNIVQNVNVK